jgi:hypothetical protein
LEDTYRSHKRKSIRGNTIMAKLLQLIVLMGVSSAALAGVPSTQIPEPSTLALLAVGAAAFAVVRRRKK